MDSPRMLHRLLRLVAVLASVGVLLGLCVANAEAQAPRIAGLTKLGQNTNQAKVKIGWHSMRGARYQFRLSTHRSSLRSAHKYYSSRSRVYTPRLRANKVYYVQARAFKGHAKGRWS